MNASMTVQAKFMNKKLSLDVLNLSSDTSLFYSSFIQSFPSTFSLQGMNQ